MPSYRDLRQSVLDFAERHSINLTKRHIPRAEGVAWCLRSVRGTRQDAAADAFVASLTTRRLDLRSALGSFAIGRNFPDHSCMEHDDDGYCMLCGQVNSAFMWPLLLEAIDRHRHGGTNHSKVLYIALDLEFFQKDDQPPSTEGDRSALMSLLKCADGMPPEARMKDLVREICGIFPSNANEREHLLTILSYCGILEDPKHPGYRLEFIPYARSKERPHWTYWNYPTFHWRGEHGVNWEAVADWFPWAAQEA